MRSPQSALFGDRDDSRRLVLFLHHLVGLGRHRHDVFGAHPLQVKPHLLTAPVSAAM